MLRASYRSWTFVQSLCILGLAAFSIGAQANPTHSAFVSGPNSAFVSVKQNSFSKDGARYAYMGVNLWYAMNLGSTGPGGDRPRLLRELNRLKSLGVRNIRILGGSEGPSTEPWRVSPALQNSPGQYDPDLLRGLDFVLAEMGKRDLTAVIMLTNFWEWSGGMAQYRRWAGAGPIPYPPADGFIEYTSKFYSDVAAQAYFFDFLQTIVSRRNSITHIRYRNDPTIMAWELANEPRGATNLRDFNIWLEKTAAMIKSLDAHHLVTTGVEGDFHDTGSGLDFLENHKSPNIDYATLHVWVQNAGIFDPLNAVRTYPEAVAWANALVERHIVLQHQLKKPVVLEEFGMARDENLFQPEDPTTYRDLFYRFLFDKVITAASTDQSLFRGEFLGVGWRGNTPSTHRRLVEAR